MKLNNIFKLSVALVATMLTEKPAIAQDKLSSEDKWFLDTFTIEQLDSVFTASIGKFSLVIDNFEFSSKYCGDDYCIQAMEIENRKNNYTFKETLFNKYLTERARKEGICAN